MIRVLHDRVLVALPPKEHEQEATTGYTYQQGETRASGIILARPADVFNVEIATRGIVVAVGEKTGQVDLDDVVTALQDVAEDVVLDHETFADLSLDAALRAIKALRPAPFDVEPGDLILFSASAGDEVTENGVSYLILHESDIIGVVDDPKES